MSDRFRNILLAASLALNVFILGALAGGAYMWSAVDDPRLADNRRGLRFAAQDLSAEQRRAYRQALAEARRGAATDIAMARESRDELARLLSQDQLDRAAIDAELAKARNADMALRTRLEQAVVDFAKTLTPAERRTLVEGLRKRGMLRQARPPKN